MAQVHAADRAGAGDFKFASALAKTFAGELLAGITRVAGRHGDLRVAETALVSGLVSALFAFGLLFQPIHWPLRVAVVFYFHNDAAWFWAAAGRQRFITA